MNAYMTTAFTELANARQSRVDNPNMLSMEQVSFLNRLEVETDEAESDRKLLCAAFLLKHFDANEFLAELESQRLVGSTELFLKAYATGVLALAAEREAR
jgi:hypothetical protein